MALVYRAHFALVARPIFTSKGVNTSALYGFTQTLLEILNKQQPTHLGVAFDTDAPTQRHADFAEYKATRQVMPEDITQALPHVRRMLDAFKVPVLICDGYEADDIIATLVRRADKAGFKSYMVTSDKDFGQLINENTFLYKPSRMGDAVEQATHLAVDHNGVQALFAAEVLVDDRLADAGLLRDLLDAGAVEALRGEQAAPDVEQLLASLFARHADAGVRAGDGRRLGRQR